MSEGNPNSTRSAWQKVCVIALFPFYLSIICTIHRCVRSYAYGADEECFGCFLVLWCSIYGVGSTKKNVAPNRLIDTTRVTYGHVIRDGHGTEERFATCRDAQESIRGFLEYQTDRDG